MPEIQIAGDSVIMTNVTKQQHIGESVNNSGQVQIIWIGINKFQIIRQGIIQNKYIIRNAIRENKQISIHGLIREIRIIKIQFV